MANTTSTIIRTTHGARLTYAQLVHGEGLPGARQELARMVISRLKADRVSVRDHPPELRNAVNDLMARVCTADYGASYDTPTDAETVALAYLA